MQLLNKFPIRFRLPALIFAALTASLLAVVWLATYRFDVSVDEKLDASNHAVLLQTIDRAEGWFEDLEKVTQGLAVDRSTAELTKQLALAFEGPFPPTLDQIRSSYIFNNPNPTGEKQRLNEGTGAGSYDAIHAEFHGHFLNVLQRYALYDLFIILPNGDVAYSVFKEDDFGTNILTGPYANSGLAQVFAAARDDLGTDSAFVDFAPYAPSAGAPASFLAKRILGDDGEVAGVFAIQLPISGLAGSVSNSPLLATEDEVYLVGSDDRLRSSPRNNSDLSIMSTVPRLEHILLAETAKDMVRLGGVTGLNGNEVIAAVAPFEIFGTTWYAILERDSYTAGAAQRDFQLFALIAIAMGAVLSLVIGVLVARSITVPLSTFGEEMQRVAQEEYDVDISGTSRKDEFGTLAHSLDTFRDNLKGAKDASIAEAQKAIEQANVVETLGNGLQGLAQGDLTVSIDQKFSEEYEGLRQNFNTTLETMNDLMRSIVDNSGEIRSRSEEISASSDELSHRTENQAATLEETAAALDELTASVREAAGSASEVENVVTKARKQAEESGAVVADAIDAMSLIRKSSTDISQIIGVIDDIAFQTNLLSLNAGVEAARAGDAGRGFAVVASEVRSLAQRSSEAAKQIKGLITSSSEQVENGVSLVGRTGDALGSIIEQFENIDSLVAGIASGSREQSAGLGEINVGMSQLDQVTQQNAAMVEESTAASTTLRNEAANLSHIVAQFKLNGSSSEMGTGGTILEFSHKTDFPQLNSDTTDQSTPFVPKKAVNSDGWSDF